MFRLFKNTNKAKINSTHNKEVAKVFLQDDIKTEYLKEEVNWSEISTKVIDIVLPKIEQVVNYIDSNFENKTYILDIVDLLIKDHAEYKIDERNNNLIPVNDYKIEMIKIEKSIINSFILKNEGYFIPNKQKASLLTDSEINNSFEWYDKFSHDNKISLKNDFDFISIDKKIVSANYCVYYLDWESNRYYGCDSSDFLYLWDTYKVPYHANKLAKANSRVNILFRLPEFIKYDNYTEYNSTDVIQNDFTTFFPRKWMKDDSFMQHFNMLLNFDFSKEMYLRSELFLKNNYFTYLGTLDTSRNLSEELISKIKNEFDCNEDGLIDAIEIQGFNELLLSYKDEIQKKGDEYVKNYVRLNNFITKKKDNIQKIYNLLINTELINDTEEHYGLLKNEINLYHKLNFHSMAMLTFLLEDEMFNYFEVYEIFDELKIFNSSWENEISSKIIDLNNLLHKIDSNISAKFDELILTIYETNEQITNSLNKLSYQNQESIKNLTEKIDNRLININSSLNTNNLLTLINTYQTYKVNLNTKKR
jgi:hypothetical protein